MPCFQKEYCNTAAACLRAHAFILHPIYRTMPTLRMRRRPKIIRVPASSAVASAVPDQVISASPASASSGAEAVPDEVVSTSNVPPRLKPEKNSDTARIKSDSKKRKRQADDGVDEVAVAGSCNGEESCTPETGIDGGEGRATAKAHPNHQQTDGKVAKKSPNTTHGGQKESDQEKDTRATEGLPPLPVRAGRKPKAHVICIARARGPVVIPPVPTANMPPLFILKSNDSAAHSPPAAFPFPSTFSLPPPPPPPPSLIEKYKSTNNTKS